MLNLNDLVGFGVGGKGPTQFNYLSRYENNATHTVYTSGSISLGPEESDRTIVALVIGESASTSATIDSVTCGGSAMTEVIKIDGTYDCLGLYQLTVPTGSSAVFSVTFSASRRNCAIVVCSLTSLEQLAARSADSGTVPSGSGTVEAIVDQFADGVTIAIGFHEYSDETFSWSSVVTEQFEEGLSIEGRFSLAAKETTDSATGVSVSFYTNQGGDIVAASWR